ncbi:10857_t:CDS:2, partial [Dentiscutata erythropus]
YTKKEDVEFNIIRSFCERLDLGFLPLVQDLRQDKENKTADGVSFKIEMNRNVIDFTDVTAKNKRLDFIVWIKNILVFKVEEKATSSNFEEAQQELLEKMDNWNNSFYGPIPYLLSYAAGETSLQFFAITNKKQLIPISSQYDLGSPLGRINVLISSFNIFRLLVTVHNFLPANGTPLYKQIKWNFDTYITILSEDTVLKEIKCFNKYINFDTLKEVYATISKSKYAVFAKEGPLLKQSKSGNFNETYFVQLTLVCHKRLPHNEKELRDAILAILNVLNLLHRKSLVHQDIRWDNILINSNNWLLSDYEHVGRNGQKSEFHLDHWLDNAYNGYDYKCDLFLVGKLFGRLLFSFSSDAQELSYYLQQQRFDNCNE